MNFSTTAENMHALAAEHDEKNAAQAEIQDEQAARELKKARNYIELVNKAFNFNLELREDGDGGFDLGEMTRPISTVFKPEWINVFSLIPLDGERIPNKDKNKIQLLSWHYSSRNRHEPPSCDDKVEGNYVSYFHAAIRAIEIYITDSLNSIAESIQEAEMAEVELESF